MSDNAGVTLSSAAMRRLHRLLSEENDPKLHFRVYITGGGCAGFQYGFMFDKAERPDDNHIICHQEIEGQDLSVTIVVDPLSMTYLEGAEVHYVESLRGSHFVVNNPNAQTTCGCGASFSIA